MRAEPVLFRLFVLVSFALVTPACGGGKPEPFIPDGGNDSSMDAGTDGMTQADSAMDGSADSDVDADVDAGPAVDCVFGTAMPLLSSVDGPSSHVPFAAEANVGGVFVAAPARTAMAYPNYERLGVLLGVNGDIYSPTNLGNAANVTGLSTTISVAQSGSGFLAMFDEGSPSNVFVRPVSETGLATGTATAISASAEGQTQGSILRTSSGFVASWMQDGDPRVAVLDTNGAIVGTSSNFAAAIGAPGTRRLYAIGGAPRLAYAGADQRVHSIGIAANGSPSSSEVTLSAQNGTANFAIAGGPSNAGLVYEADVGGGTTAIVFRSINSNGTASLAERTLTNTIAGDRGARPSIIAIAGGYMIVYRAKSVLTTDTPLRMVVVSSAGVPLGTLDLAASFPDLRFALLGSPDGQLYVAFEEIATVTTDGGSMLAGTTLRAFKIVCE